MKPLRVLIADDFQPFRVGLKQAILKHDGIEVVGQARDGIEAIILTKHWKPDLVFLDISMPNLNGFEAARQIREQSPDTKIVLVSAYHEETYRVLSNILRVDAYISKSELSSDLPDLLERMQQHVKSQH